LRFSENQKQKVSYFLRIFLLISTVDSSIATAKNVRIIQGVNSGAEACDTELKYLPNAGLGFELKSYRPKFVILKSYRLFSTLLSLSSYQKYAFTC
jgi:hypothetical protein